MRKILFTLLIILTLLCVFGCKEDKIEATTTPNDTTQASKNEGLSDIIVVYFSATNNTKAAAEYIAKELNCAIFEIVPTEKYTNADLDWRNPNSRVSLEEKDPSILPKFNSNLVPELSVYKTLIIGYPIWGGEAPNIMKSYLNSYEKLPDGLTVIPFCTSHSSPMGNSAKNLFKGYSYINLKEGKRFELKPSEEEVAEWVKSLNLN